jgi:hypothetical protein
VSLVLDVAVAPEKEVASPDRMEVERLVEAVE